MQEAEAKWPALRAASDLKLHLIGPLQTNKARDAVALFDVIETLDRARLARGAGRGDGASSGRRPSLFVEVNTGEEPQKAGVRPRDADGFIADCRGDSASDRGADVHPAGGRASRPCISPCWRKIAERNGLRSSAWG